MLLVRPTFFNSEKSPNSENTAIDTDNNVVCSSEESTYDMDDRSYP